MYAQSSRERRAQADGFVIGGGARSATGPRRSAEQVEKDAIFGAAQSGRDEIFGSDVL